MDIEPGTSSEADRDLAALGDGWTKSLKFIHKVLKQKLSILLEQCQSSLYQCYGFCRLKR